MQGRCLCGAVKVELDPPVRTVGVCHCAMCRRWCSGPWMAIQAPHAKITGEALVRFRASMFAERGFCGACGSSIFHRPQDGPELAVSAGLFEPEGLSLAYEIFVDGRPDFYRLDAQVDQRDSVAMAMEWGPRLLWRRLLRWLGVSGAGARS